VAKTPAPTAADNPAEAPVVREPIECARPGCGEVFVPQRSTARYHSATCRQRAARARKAAEHNAAENAKTGTRDEHDLVKAVRLELTQLDKLDTVNGQLVLQLARRAANPDESSLVALSKEIDARMTAARGAVPAAGSKPAPAEDDDDVTKARAARDRKRAGLGEASAG
jgi:hypothetical protein